MTLLLIKLNHLLTIASNEGFRVRFSNDADVQDSVHDLTALIKIACDAVCKINGLADQPSGFSSDFRVIGKSAGRAMEFTSQYVGDTVVMLGSTELYLKRHITRAFNVIESYFRLRTSCPPHA